ncbi:Membrane transport protein [Pseudooceanicola marinus]|uniref:Membrane transport protein n=1 Tax=Pseudooceanicola marinus TaxID=396013 RepID=A0A1X6ZV76_9RHOB|nr:AEC family transporter [Pseudooceanicola marinus]PJE30505.1 transporter [Pseudooceanicola marinus]SLN62498.1 Membrane transport protein [Pseudooceanicola marinus]
MNLVLTVLEITAPVFLLAAIGFTWVRMGFDYQIDFVTRLAMTLSVPCLIFTALMKTEIDPAALTALSLAAVAAYAALTAVTALAIWGLKLEMRSYLSPLIFGNTGNLGLPLALFAFGEAGLSYAVVVFAVMAVWNFTFGVWIVSGGGSVVRALKEPLLWATILGGIFLSQGWQTPLFLTNTLELVGQLAIPLMLITVGVAVARLRPGSIRLASWLSVLKVVLCVAIAWVTGRAFGLDDVAFAVLVLQISTPVAVTSYLLAVKYGADADAVAGLVVVSTLLSVLLLPALLAVLL